MNEGAGSKGCDGIQEGTGRKDNDDVQACKVMVWRKVQEAMCSDGV